MAKNVFVCRRSKKEIEEELEEIRQAHKVSADEVEEIWEEIRSEMKKDAKNNPYNKDDHHCCTVAFNSLRKVRDNSKKFCLNLSHIKKRDYNICGRGIYFDKQDDSYWDYVKGGKRVISDSVTCIPKIITRGCMDVAAGYHNPRYVIHRGPDELPEYFDPVYLEDLRDAESKKEPECEEGGSNNEIGISCYGVTCYNYNPVDTCQNPD